MPPRATPKHLLLTCCVALLSTAARAAIPKAGLVCDDVRVAIIRFQINEWLTEDWKSESAEEVDSSKETFFISVNDQDPSKEFMECLSDLPGRIRYASQKGWRNFHVADSQTGEYAVEFWVKQVRLRSRTVAEIEAGHDCGMSCGAQIRFQLREIAGHWRVTRKLHAVYE